MLLMTVHAHIGAKAEQSCCHKLYLQADTCQGCTVAEHNRLAIAVLPGHCVIVTWRQKNSLRNTIEISAACGAYTQYIQLLLGWSVGAASMCSKRTSKARDRRGCPSGVREQSAHRLQRSTSQSLPRAACHKLRVSLMASRDAIFSPPSCWGSASSRALMVTGWRQPPENCTTA